MYVLCRTPGWLTHCFSLMENLQWSGWALSNSKTQSERGQQRARAAGLHAPARTWWIRSGEKDFGVLIRTLMRVLEAVNLQSPDSLSQQICGNRDMTCSIKKLTLWAGSVLLAECETKNIDGKVFSGCKLGTRTCKICRILIFFLVFLWTDFWPDYKKSSWTMAHWFSVLHHCASSNDTLIVRRSIFLSGLL